MSFFWSKFRRFNFIAITLFLASGCTLSNDLTNVGQGSLATVEVLFCADKEDWVSFNSFGAGTNVSPYLICNASQLASIGSTPASLTSYYKLMGNIDLAPYYSEPNPQFMIGQCTTGCAIWDIGAKNFQGKFDGSGYTIANFSYVSPASGGIGFFSNTWTGAEISNLNLTNVNISGGTESGGLIGTGFATKVHLVQVQGSVTGSGARVGGVIGNGYHVVVGNSSFSGSVTSSADRVGGLIGSLSESSIYASKSSGVITTTTNIAGGLIGIIDGSEPSRVSNSYSTATVTGSAIVGGLIGDFIADQGIVQKSYSTGAVDGTAIAVGGLLGRVGSSSTIQDSYATGNVRGTTGSTWVGYLVGENSGTIVNSYYHSGSTCDSTGSGGICGTTGTARPNLNDFYNSALAPMNSWDNLATSADGLNNFWSFDGSGHAKIWFETHSDFITPFSSGSGSIVDPYLLTSVTEWNQIIQNPRYMHLNFKLSNDLDFASGSFQQIGGELAPFTGQFDGDSNTLFNIVNNVPSLNQVGVFGILAANGLISNLRISNISISGFRDVGGLVGLVDASRVENVIISGGSVTAASDNCGGVVGRVTKADVFKVGSNLNVTGASFVGGVVGYIFASTISESYSKGSILGVNQVGGVVGKLEFASFINNYSRGNVTSSGAKAGGLIGESTSNIYSSYTSATVLGVAEVGGAVGAAGGILFEDVFTTSSVTGANGSSEVGVLLGSSTTPTFSNVRYWSGAACDSTGAGGACNTTGAVGVATESDFQLSTNAPLSAWDFATIWEVVVGDLPRLVFE